MGVVWVWSPDWTRRGRRLCERFEWFCSEWRPPPPGEGGSDGDQCWGEGEGNEVNRVKDGERER